MLQDNVYKASRLMNVHLLVISSDSSQWEYEGTVLDFRLLNAFEGVSRAGNVFRVQDESQSSRSESSGRCHPVLRNRTHEQRQYDNIKHTQTPITLLPCVSEGNSLIFIFKT